MNLKKVGISMGKVGINFKKLLKTCSVMACGFAFLGFNASAVRYLKLIVVGDYASGKSEVYHTFLNDDNFDPIRNRTINLSNQERRLQYVDPANGIQEDVRILAWDTAGEERFHGLTKTFFRGAKIAFVTVDAGEIVKNNFNVDALRHQIERWANETFDVSPNCKIVLTATKCDLIDRFEKDRLRDTLQHTARIMNQSGQFALTLLSSAKTQRNQLRHDMENKIKLCIDSIDVNKLPDEDVFPRAAIERVPITESYVVKVGKGACSGGHDETRTRITGYESKLVLTD